MKSFSNKVAVITGAGSGMGRYLAILMAKAGANVAI
ncbi:MAG: short-chain dehydrogenase, partial [Porticoccaceae bacterium]|nr:short-chain dehydrogenase [Porticoccaceae bacterium]